MSKEIVNKDQVVIVPRKTHDFIVPDRVRFIEVSPHSRFVEVPNASEK